jgi:endogenous inhibitor of DNA gyrase (YacG/DUF329 family)
MSDAPKKPDPRPVLTGQAAPTADASSCPICHGVTSFAVDNRHRPFCSSRCQMVDLSNWLGERYAVPGPEVSLDSPAAADGAEAVD